MRIGMMRRAVLVVLFMTVPVLTAEPKLVNERMIFGPRDQVSQGLLKMRVTPGGKYLLYFRSQFSGRRRDRDTGELKEVWLAYMWSRDMVTGEDC